MTEYPLAMFVLAALLVTGSVLFLTTAFAATSAPVETPVRWVALPEHGIELGLKPDGTVVWKQALTNDVNVSYRTGP